jgi:putative transposase
MVESLWGRTQTELLDHQRWATRLELSTAVFDCIEVFYDPGRRRSAPGYISSIEFERRNQQTATAV